MAKQFPAHILALFFATYPFLCGVGDGVAALCLVGVATVCAAVCVWRGCFKVTLADVLAGLAAAWIVAGYFIGSRGLIDPTKIYEFAALCLVWFVVRNTENHTRVVQSILLSALAQVVLCGIQVAGLAKSNHSFFQFTGSFFNPGPLAGFLAAAMFACPYLWSRKNRIWLVACALATIATIILSGSRAAALAVLVGAAVCCLPKIHKRTAIIIGIVSIVLCAGLYFLKPDSADGRLLVWKASASMFAESPVVGNGPDAFERDYMYHQAAYLEDKLMSDEATLADNVIFAFSEPVRVLCEYGVVGLLIFGALIFVLIFSAKSRPLLAGLLAWLVFGLFSYPADVGPLRLLFVIIAAMLAGGTRTLKDMTIGPPAKIVATLGLVVLATAATMNYIHPRTDLDPDRLYVDGGKLLHDKKCDEAIPVFEQAAKIAPSSLLLVDLGKCCYAVGRKSEAEKCLRTAVDMTPALATPAYELFDFYRREERTEEARKWAEYLVTRKFKATNSVTLFARKQAKEYLEEHGGRQIHAASTEWQR